MGIMASLKAQSNISNRTYFVKILGNVLFGGDRRDPVDDLQSV
jgi:hypothetical protein